MKLSPTVAYHVARDDVYRHISSRTLCYVRYQTQWRQYENKDVSPRSFHQEQHSQLYFLGDTHKFAGVYADDTLCPSGNFVPFAAVSGCFMIKTV